MSANTPENIPAAEPTVTVLWSESNHLYDGQVMPLSRANEAFRELDTAIHTARTKSGYEGSWYDKTSFKLDFWFRGEKADYSGRQDFGDHDGDGSLLDHIEPFAKNSSYVLGVVLFLWVVHFDIHIKVKTNIGVPVTGYHPSLSTTYKMILEGKVFSDFVLQQMDDIQQFISNRFPSRDS